MLKYEDHIDVPWFQNTSQSADELIRSTFDYITRQRRGLRGYPKTGVRISGGLELVRKFKAFWAALNYGTDKFKTDMLLFGEIGKDKVVRFTRPYTLEETGYLQYRITCEAEIIELSTTALGVGCPRVPQTGLVPQTGMVPCG